MKRILAWICIIFGVLLALVALGGPQSTQGADPRLVIFITGGLFITAGVRLLRKKKQSAFGSRVGEAKKGKPTGYSTKNCPACNAEIPIDSVKCEYCDKKQKEGDSTCGSGETTTSAARAFFNRERNIALKAGSKTYVWTAIAGACKRCRLNDGKEFRWDTEPVGGHAGAVARCNCIPLAVVHGIKQRPREVPGWKKKEEALQPARDMFMREIIPFIQNMFARQVAPERIVHRHFWSREYFVFDNNVKQPILAIELHNPDDKKIIFFSKSEETLAQGGSRRVRFNEPRELEKHKGKLEAALQKYL